MSLRSCSSAVLLATLSLTVPALTGCSGSFADIPNPQSAVSVKGNWQFASSSPAASRLPAFSGALTGTSLAIKGIFHSDSASACVAPNTSFDVSGGADLKNVVILTGGLAGGTLTVTGNLSDDGKSLSNTTYNVTGGTCAFTQAAAASAQAYADITGTYTGNFTTSGGDVIPVVANLTQAADSDGNGNFTLSGSGTFPYNPCFNSPVSVSNAQVTGGSFTMTYSDQTTGNQVTGTGTFTPDGTTLTVTGWGSSGPCGTGTGTGTFTKQQSSGS